MSASVVIIQIGDCSDFAPLLLPAGSMFRIVGQIHCDEPGLFDLAALEPETAVVDLRASDPESVGNRLRMLRQRFDKLRLVTVGLPGDEAAARAAVIHNVAAHMSRDVSPAALERALQAVHKGQLNLGATAQRAIQRIVRGD
jgi:DNA-binding NarL/FixJ family response regulator